MVCLHDFRVGLFAHIIILMLWALIWVTGLLSVNYNIRALHYVFAILCLALGVFVILIYILASSKVSDMVLHGKPSTIKFLKFLTPENLL